MLSYLQFIFKTIETFVMVKEVTVLVSISINELTTSAGRENKSIVCGYHKNAKWHTDIGIYKDKDQMRKPLFYKLSRLM